METQQPTILVVGGANTGRSPIAVSLLRRMLERRGVAWDVSSAGVIGYDDDPADSYASIAMSSVFGLTLHGHQARSISADMVADATVVLAIDSSIMHVLRGQYPDRADRMVTLGHLAGCPRDIPDPYRMDISAWITYAQEIDQLLRAGLERLIELVQQYMGEPIEALPPQEPAEEPAEPPPPEPNPSPPDTDGPQATAPPLPTAEAAEAFDRDAAIERCNRLFDVMRDMPALISWEGAHEQLAREVQAMGNTPSYPEDLRPIYANLLLTLLSMNQETPPPEQLAQLQQAIVRMQSPVDQVALTALSTLLSEWARDKR